MKRAVPAKIYILVPVTVRRILTVSLKILECEKFPARMVKHAVHNDPDAAFMALLHKMTEVLIVSQPAVYPFIILCAIPVGGGLKQRSDVHSGKPVFPHMRDPRIQLLQPVNLSFLLMSLRRPQKPQRVNMIKNGFLIPF